MYVPALETRKTGTWVVVLTKNTPYNFLSSLVFMSVMITYMYLFLFRTPNICMWVCSDRIQHSPESKWLLFGHTCFTSPSTCIDWVYEQEGQFPLSSLDHNYNQTLFLMHQPMPTNVMVELICQALDWSILTSTFWCTYQWDKLINWGLTTK